MEGIILILFGLAVDICGAILIIKPLLNRIKKLNPDKQRPFQEKYIIQPSDEETEWKYQQWAKCGFVFLITGFVLQIIGNYIQSVQ